MKRLAKAALNKVRRYLIVRQVNKADVPQFAASEVVRRHYIFAGKVQKVGFRLEVLELSKRLGLSGWCKNLPPGEVEAELQGEAAKLDFLVAFMHSLKRIRIERMDVAEVPLLEEQGFAVTG